MIVFRPHFRAFESFRLRRTHCLQLESKKTLQLSIGSMRSDGSQQSEGGLSRVNSFAGSSSDEDGRDMGPSDMVPGGGNFEKGKWVRK